MEDRISELEDKVDKLNKTMELLLNGMNDKDKPVNEVITFNKHLYAHMCKYCAEKNMSVNKFVTELVEWKIAYEGPMEWIPLEEVARDMLKNYEEEFEMDDFLLSKAKEMAVKILEYKYKIGVAKRMEKMNFSVEQISEATELSVGDLEKLFHSTVDKM